MVPRDKPAGLPGLIPVVSVRKKRHPSLPHVRLLDDVSEDVVAAVAVHQDHLADPLLLEGSLDVANDAYKCSGADADGAREGAVFVGTRHRDRWQWEEFMVLGDSLHDGAGHDR